MAECSFARCQQERRAIRKELQRWTKNMVYILGLERVAEELMGRRKWKLYQDALIPRRSEGEASSGDESMPSTDPPPALKIKTIEEINAPEEAARSPEEKKETILESLIKRPATQPKLEVEEPTDWKPADKCYFCVDGEKSEGDRATGGPTSPASESDSSSVSGAKSPAGGPPLLQHLLQLQLQQGQNPQAIAQFQQMLAALAALGTAPALSQAWMIQRLAQPRPQLDRLPDVVDKVAAASASPSLAEQPLDLSAKSTSSTSGTPPPDVKSLDNSRLKRSALDTGSNSVTRRAYTEDELQSALRDIQSGRLGTRRAAVVYGIPRSTLRNKVNKFGLASDVTHDSDQDSDPDRPESPPSVILKIPTFPPPDDKSPSPATPVTTPVTPITPILPQPTLNPSQLLLPPVFADQSSTQLLTSLNDVIAKSISQKFQQPMDRPPHLGDLQFMRPDRHVSVIKTPPDNQRNYAAPSNSRGAPNNNGQPATGGKGTRPKRGKYRNYDRDSLVEAVKAVQRGEMSVHRAGSYYGVPHSTLEYKVKERHLMRPRKREPKPQQEVKPQPPKPPQPKPPTKPFSNGLNGPEGPGYPPGYPFWQAGFAPPAPDLYASHMMRRLREEAPPPANGSFLEGIIRSSLERPGAALLQRLTGEPPRLPAEAPTLLRRLAGGGGAGSEEDGPPARRARVDSSDRALAAEMREAVQRLRADKLRPRNGTPTPPPAPPDAPLAAPLATPLAAPPDRT